MLFTRHQPRPDLTLPQAPRRPAAAPDRSAACRCLERLRDALEARAAPAAAGPPRRR